MQTRRGGAELVGRTRGKEELRAMPRGGKRKTVVYVFTEGKETEPSFIDIIWERRLSAAGPAPNIDVRIANRKAPGSQRKPLTLVEAAARTLREKTREAKKAKTPMHVRIPGHRADFWRLLGSALPEYEERRAELDELGRRMWMGEVA